MEPNTENEETSNKKPLNIVLLGDESSEKEKLMSKFLLLNSPQFQENEEKIQEDKEEDISLFQNVIHCVEMHGEKLKMKLWDNPSTDEFLSPSIKIAQGILLFYSVKSRKSFEKIQKDLSKIIELGRFDIPIIVIGNHKTSQEREVTYEEAKTWADNYGLRFYETSIEKDGSIKTILQDIGEQLLFQECINTATVSNNNSVIINDIDKDENINLEENLNIGSLIESKNKESDKKGKQAKSEKKQDINFGKNFSSNDVLNTDNNIYNKKKKNIKHGLYQNNSSKNFKKIKTKLNKNKTLTTANLNRNQSLILNTEINQNSNYSTLNTTNKTKKLIKKNTNSIFDRTSNFFHSKKYSLNSLNLTNSTNDVHSYLKKTALTKNREKEIKEKKIIKEQLSQSISAQREREGIELKKKKIMEDKENILKKIKEDKILQKEKEKQKKEEELKNAKSNYDKIKQEKEIASQEKKLEKEKDKQNKIALKLSEKEKYNKKVEELNKKREKDIENMKMKKEKEKEREKEREKEKEKIKEERQKENEKNKEQYKEQKINKEKENEEKIKSIKNKKIKTTKEKDKEKTSSPNKHHKNNSLFNFSITSKLNKPENINNTNTKKKVNNKIKPEKQIIKEKNKNADLTEKILTVKIEDIHSDKIKLKEEIKNNFNNYQINDIYRCLKCNLIPKIIFNEYNQEIEVLCDHSKSDKTHHNFISYQNFQSKSLDHPLNEKISCYFCYKSLNKLDPEDMIYYCPLCELYFCSKDENVHRAQKHQNEIDIKNKYKSIFEKKITKKRMSVELDIGKKIKNENGVHNRKLSLKNNMGIGKQDLKKNENKNNDLTKNDVQKELIKIPIYLIDNFCSIHDEIYNSYCHSCNKNICSICKTKSHENHIIENFEDIMITEDELNKKKIELDLVKDNLSKINEYFVALLEAIKCKFEKIYKAKQKEIEIKEKIIKDFEKIKYNYNSIINIKNLNLINKKNFVDSNTNITWLERLNLIFEYLNSPLTSERSNIFKDINSEKYNIKNYEFNNEEIKTLLKLENNLIALSNDKGELKIYDTEKMNLLINKKLFNDTEKINHMSQLKNGEIACCGNEQIKFMDLDLFNSKLNLKKIITEYNNNFLSLIELKNDFLISSGTTKGIQLWVGNKNNLYKCLNNLKNKEIDYLYKIGYNSFVGCSYKDKEIIKYSITKNNEINIDAKLDNISVIKGNNSMLKLDFDNDKDKGVLLINFEDNNNYGIMIIKIDKFEILSKIYNLRPFYYINILETGKIITIDENAFIQKWNYLETENKLYENDKTKIFNEYFSDGHFKGYNEFNKDIFLLQQKNEIILFSKPFNQY